MPRYRAAFDYPFAVEWGRIRYNEGAWITWANASDFAATQQTLTPPDGPFYFAGDWLSSLGGWQAGAFVSAHRTICALHARASA